MRWQSCLGIALIYLVAGFPQIARADSGAAVTLPVTPRLVHGELTLANEQVVQFAVLDGAMLTVRDSVDGYYLGFTPIIEDEDDLQVTFTVFEITEYGPGLEGLKQIDELKAAEGLSAVSGLSAFSEIKVKTIVESGLSDADIQAIRDRHSPFPDFAEKAGEDTPGPEINGGCCVTCGSTTACGCAVGMSCGSCCSGSCCGGGGGGPGGTENQG